MIPFGGFMPSTGLQPPAVGTKGSAASFGPDGSLQTGGDESVFPACIQDLLGLDDAGNSQAPQSSEIQTGLLGDADSEVTEWLVDDLREMDLFSGELPVDPDFPSGEIAPIHLPGDLSLSAGLNPSDAAMASNGTQTQVPEGEAQNNGTLLGESTFQRSMPSGPAVPHMPVQSQPMGTGMQASGSGQMPAPTPSTEDTFAGSMAAQNGDAESVTGRNPSGPKAPAAPVDLQHSAPPAETLRITDKNTMEGPGRQPAAVKGEMPEKPVVSPSVQTHSKNTVQHNPAGNLTDSGDNKISYRAPSGQFQKRDTEQSPQRAESLESEKNTFSTVSGSESAKPGAAESVKAPPVFHVATRIEQPQPAASSAAKMGEMPEKAFQTTVMDQVVDRAALRTVQGRSEVQIRLKPEYLGNVQMNISTDKEQVVVRIMTDQPVVKEIIETHLHHLKTELGNQGLTIDRFDIAVNPDAENPNQRDQFANMFKNNSSRDGQGRSNSHGRESDTHEEAGKREASQPGRDGISYFA
ncbi:MAG: hypothetical protein CR984_05595 [Proteobacteria bacterium]|nr:MAG: hypothetical protein CR984_05595 [Pseudomonadota bacterium]PIE67138.1 MAG: hypothetical protein CSA23_05675 [Deltaproteobacteria bacterium]